MPRQAATKLKGIPRLAGALLLLPILLLVLAASRIPPSTLPALGGGEIDPLRLEHEYTLLFFWSADCKPSTDDLETLQTEADWLTGQYDLGIVTIAWHTDAEAVPAWLTLPTALDAAGTFGDELGVAMTPSTVIIRDGRAVTGKTGGETDFRLLMGLAARGLDYGPDTPPELTLGG